MKGGGNFGESNFPSQSAQNPSRLNTAAEDQIRVWIPLLLACLFGALPINQGVSFDAPAFVAPGPFVASGMKTPFNPPFHSPAVFGTKKKKKKSGFKSTQT